MASLFPALPVLAADSNLFLTNQNGTQTTQFQAGDDIYIEGNCAPATQDVIKIYITDDKTWQLGDHFSDISGYIETFSANADGKVPRTKIWTAYTDGAYDVAIDSNNDFVLQDYEQQCILGLTGEGFRIGNPTPPPAPVVATPPPAPVVPTPAVYTPPPAPAPVVAPAPVAEEPSIMFSLGGYVEVKSLSNVRESPGGALTGSQNQGALGAVAGGPVQKSLSGNKYWFWNINFEEGTDGWVAESTIKSAPAPAPEAAAATAPAPAEPAAQQPQAETAPQEQAAAETNVAQVSRTAAASGSSPLMNSAIIGGALFFGLIFGSMILARAFRRN